MGMTFTKPRRLEEGENLAGFCCGVNLVDRWAANWAPKARSRGTAVVYVSYCAENGAAAGFYSLCSHSIMRENLAGGWLKRNAPVQVPVILMGMLGVDERFKGQRLGSMLLRDAVLKALSAAEAVGAKALVVDPADENARRFYQRYGFREIPGLERMFIPLTAGALK